MTNDHRTLSTAAGLQRQAVGAGALDVPSRLGAAPATDGHRATALRDALLHSWGPDTCAPEDQPAWCPDNPARGQCITTVLVVHDWLGGVLLRGEVHVEGALVDHHWWNRLPDGTELDFTRQQFGPNEVVSGGIPIARLTKATIRPVAARGGIRLFAVTPGRLLTGLGRPVSPAR